MRERAPGPRRFFVKQIVVALGLFAAPAFALTPQDAAVHAAELGRPLPSYVRMTPQQDIEQSREPGRIFATADAFTVFLNRFGGSYSCGNDDSSRNVSSVVCG